MLFLGRDAFGGHAEQRHVTDMLLLVTLHLGGFALCLRFGDGEATTAVVLAVHALLSADARCLLVAVAEVTRIDVEPVTRSRRLELLEDDVRQLVRADGERR